MSEIINCFPGYEYIPVGKDGKPHNMYRGTDVGFGGYVYAEPGFYTNVALIDVASMHPTSIVLLNKLGDYTQRYADLRKARVFIKHEDYDSAGNLFDGKLKKYLASKEEAEELSKALKLPLNAFFGISCAGYDNPARDSRDVNNIIALRGALFMRTLQDEIINRGFKVIHIKTDSIKIPNATKEIVDFCQEFGKKYGYDFEFEALYDRICLVNDAVYIAKYADPEWCKENYKFVPGDNAKASNKEPHMWTATGAQFKQSYVFKRLFSKEDILFNDLCETREVKTALYLDMNESLPDVSKAEAEVAKLIKQIKDPKSKLNSLDDQEEIDKQKKIINDRIEELKEIVKTGHNYIFVGKTGQFCPMIDGCGAGILLRENTNRETYDSAPNSSGYRWMESEMVRSLGKENFINKKYFETKCDEAINDISKYCDFYQFTQSERLSKNLIEQWLDINSDELPF